MNKDCPDDKILNPKTKRCVSKTGVLGKQLQKENKPSSAAKSSKPKNECPDDKILNPKTKRCVSKTGALGKQLQKENKPSSASKSSNKKDLKKTIIRGLYIIKNYEKKYTNNKAIINECTKVISQLYNYNKPILSYKDFISNIKADDYINKKIEELIKEGKIKFEKINKTENKPSSAAKSSNEKDLKKTIISHLILIKQYEMANNNVFKAKAYQKVISQLNNCNEPILTYEDFVLHIKAGDRINKKVEELIREGKIKYEEENIKEDDVFKFRQALNKIYGIGEAKIKAIIKEGITSMDDLRKNQHLLNDKQKIGLAYYDDLNMRIPLDEYLKHKKILEGDLTGLTYDFVGSFRRGATSMGDIDMLIMKNDKFDLPNYIKKLQSSGYIKEILALGKLKTSCIVKIGTNPARQVDILVSPFNEYYFSLLYFTGSADFNIGFRNYVKTKYDVSLSEHGIKEDKLKLPIIKSEKDIFDFFKIKYVEPKKRKLFFTP